jgi:ankyrin repeat protein
LVNARNRNGDTPLMFACGARQAAVAALLLNRGANPAAANSEGITAVMVAAGQGQPLALSALLRHGGSSSGRSSSLLVSAADAHGNGPLAFASRAGAADCVQLLLDTPAVAPQVFARNAAGQTPLDEAKKGRHTAAARWVDGMVGCWGL